MPALSPRELSSLLKAAGDPTRLRLLLLLLAEGELNVTDLTRILDQSQPRVSRHLKLLVEAGLIERFRDGSWVYFHLAERGPGRAVIDLLTTLADRSAAQSVGDRVRAAEVKLDRAAAAQDYFKAHAADWNRIRALHVAEADVEAAMRRILGPGPFGLLLDLGTGTGRTLELLADRYRRGLGLDLNEQMLALARGRLAAAGLTHADVRHGDITRLALADQAASVVIMHQVLHFLADPLAALKEAARVLEPGGRLLIVDFAAHAFEFLRDDFAHQRLGFTGEQVGQWLAECGLEVKGTSLLEPPPGGERISVLIVEAARSHDLVPPRSTSERQLETTR